MSEVVARNGQSRPPRDLLFSIHRLAPFRFEEEQFFALTQPAPFICCNYLARLFLDSVFASASAKCNKWQPNNHEQRQRQRQQTNTAVTNSGPLQILPLLTCSPYLTLFYLCCRRRQIGAHFHSLDPKVTVASACLFVCFRLQLNSFAPLESGSSRISGLEIHTAR